MTHNLAPLYLSSLVPQSVSNITRYNLRNSNDLQTIDARTTLYYNSFLPSTVRAWNNVHEEAKHSDSINTFKGFLNKDKPHIPKHFYVGNRKAQILHTRLRTNCSSLNLDLFYKEHFRFSSMPLRWCGKCPTLLFSLQKVSSPTNRTHEHSIAVSDSIAVHTSIWQ